MDESTEKAAPGVVGPTKMARKSIKLRPAVRRFAEAMERVLRDNDHKGGWEEMSNCELIERMEDELKELHEEMFHSSDDPDLGSAVHEAIDLANFAMMFFDNNRDHYTEGDKDV